MLAGRPSVGDVEFGLTACFYGARSNSDGDNLLKGILDSLNGLAFSDDSRCVEMRALKLPVDDKGPRAEIDLWVEQTAGATA
jgi:Holliday junction resolvase RusA-like endonuclease